jgi:hypothetical protein
MTTEALAAALRTMADAQDAIKAEQRGPWRWHGQRSGPIQLTTVGRGLIYVMGFIRHGMRGAQPTFQTYPDAEHPDNGLMTPAADLAVQEVPYRDDIVDIDHPVAAFIVAAASIDWSALSAAGLSIVSTEELEGLRAVESEARVLSLATRGDHARWFRGSDLAGLRAALEGAKP